MVRRPSPQDVAAVSKMQQDEFFSTTTKQQRNKKSYHHRYKTLRAKVKDVVGSAYGSSMDVSPPEVAAGQFLPGRPRPYEDDAAGGCEVSMDSRQPSPSLRSVESPALFDDRVQDTTNGHGVDEEQDLTDPAEWRKFIDSVKKEVAGRPAVIPPDSGRSARRVQRLSQDENSEEHRAGLRTPVGLRRLLAFNNRGDRPGEDDEDYRRSSQRAISPTGSPSKRSLSPSKFRRRRSDASQSTITSDERRDAITNRSRFRLPRFSSPSRRSPYAQLEKPVRDLSSQESGDKKDCPAIPDISGISSEAPQEAEQVEPSQCPEPQETTTTEAVQAAPAKKGRKVIKKKPKSAPVAKPIPADIRELNEQVLRAVGSAQHRLDDDDTTGEATRSIGGKNAQGDSIDQDDLLSSINISTTSGIQVKGDKEKEEMLHQTIARRVLSVLIRPAPQGNENDASAGLVSTETTNSSKLAAASVESTTKKDKSPSDDDFTDAPDDGLYADGESTTLGGDLITVTTTTESPKSATASADKIREQLKALKAKTEHLSLKKKFEKSRKKRGSSGKKVKTLTKKKSSSTKQTNSSSKRQTDVEKASSYESFDDSFASKADAATCCFFSSLLSCCCCCADSSKSDDNIASDDEKTLYSDVSLDTYESGWGGGRPLPILSPSDFSAERDDVLDVIEKGLCGTI
jgi:hypothetical protein